MIKAGTRVRLAGGETGRIYGPPRGQASNGEDVYIIELDQPRSNGEGYASLRESELEVCS